MVATWAPPNPGAAKKYGLFLMFGYTIGGYLVTRTTPSPMLRTMWADCTPVAAEPAAEDRAKTDYLRQAHG
jgi:hypothetical protein